MPRYFFDIDDSVAIRDHEGQEFDCQEQAQAEAFRQAAAYGSNPANLQKSGVIVVTVRNGSKFIALRVRLVCQVETGLVEAA